MERTFVGAVRFLSKLFLGLRAEALQSVMASRVNFLRRCGLEAADQELMISEDRGFVINIFAQ